MKDCSAPSLICASVAVQRSFCRPSRAYRSRRLSLPFFFFFFLLFQLVLHQAKQAPHLRSPVKDDWRGSPNRKPMLPDTVRKAHLRCNLIAHASRWLTQEGADLPHSAATLWSCCPLLGAWPAPGPSELSPPPPHEQLEAKGQSCILSGLRRVKCLHSAPVVCMEANYRG